MAKAPSEPAEDNSQSKPHGTTSATDAQSSAPLATQVAFLQQMVSTLPAEEAATDDLASLLQQLDVAENVAQGVENKLDKLLENLEGMLDGLEKKGDNSSRDGDAKDESGSPKPPDTSTNAKDSG